MRWQAGAVILLAWLVGAGIARTETITTTPAGGGAPTTIANGITFTGGTDKQVCFNDGGSLSCGDAGLTYTKGTGAVGLASAGQLNWNADTVLSRFAAGTLGLTRTTNPTILQVYSTTDSITSPTNYSRVIVDAGTTAATFKIGSEHGGSGTAMTKLIVQIDGTNKLDYAVTNANAWTVASQFFVSTANISFINDLAAGTERFFFPAGSATVVLGRTSTNSFLQFGGSTSSFPQIKRVTTGLQIRLADDSLFAGLAALNLQSAFVYSAAGTALPACAGGTEGTHASVSDATAPTYGSTYTSGGAVHSTVYCNGTSWIHSG